MMQKRPVSISCSPAGWFLHVNQYGREGHPSLVLNQWVQRAGAEACTDVLPKTGVSFKPSSWNRRSYKSCHSFEREDETLALLKWRL